jgi:hypothetical protein
MALAVVGATTAAAQENYEIQVYSYDTVPPGETMVESHMNVTTDGRRGAAEGVVPTQGAFHETIEITHGINPWFEVGFYLFTSIQPNGGWNWVGNHIRPRVRAPESWHWPVGVSLSAECGYQRRSFSADTWSCELRPIVDKTWGRFYASFNPTIDRSFRGENVDKGFGFAPNLKVSWDFTPKITGGIEYYGALGQISHFDPPSVQEHQIFPAIDLKLSPRWEFNFGIGFGLSAGTDRLIVKAIVGRRFGSSSKAEP